MTLPSSQQLSSLTLTQPDDWHLHLRDNAELTCVLPHSTRCFARALIMPNLQPPIVNTIQALAYRERILTALPSGTNFSPLMTLYLTPDLTVNEIYRAAASNCVYAVKLYPAGATTNSQFGITNLQDIYSILEALQKLNMPLSIHAETPDPDIDIFDRESVFIERYLTPIIEHFPALRMVIEHITTKEGIQFVENAPPNIAATITAHHLLYNRNALLTNCIRPHFYCLPILKRESHRQALLTAATSNNPKFFLGTDSAPHTITAKQSHCGCAGSFTAHAAIELYAEAFEQVGALDRLEAFASWHGADFYCLPRNQQQIKLIKTPWQVPEFYTFGNNRVVPLRALETVNWKLQSLYNSNLHSINS